jgi:formylglycine-generating enzyme required for sulfatase activity/predicted MPP superfamily phosphohydrolase/energy-coupling factor transporter ATP-binding protein EcfA2
MMSKITILHLSDVHFKTKEKESTPTFRQDVTTKMIDTIQQHLDKHHVVPEVVAVTGDIAFSGKEYEYDDAKIFFKDLKAVLPSKTEFLAVPGNHDVDRDRVGPCFPLYETIIEKELIDLFLNNEKHIQDFIDVKFKNFRAFIDEVIPGLYASKNDYFWVKDFLDNKVSFLGLNSCWASGKDNEAARIALGYPQVMKALALAKQENKIILMHHPLFDWLEERDTCKCRGEIFNRCALVLHGHRHVDDQLVLKGPSGPCICLGANASYTKDKNGFIGFQSIEVEFRQRGAEVTVWPYRLDSRTRVKFVPDTHRRDDQEGKPFFVLKTYEDDAAGIEPTIPLEIPKEYKDWVRQFHSKMDIDLLARKGEAVTVDLPELYIPIETRSPFYKPDEEEHKKSKSDKYLLESTAEPRTGKEPETKEPPSIDIEVLMGREKCILLRGGAGTGKTTLIKHLAYTVSHDMGHSSLKGYLPVMVFLKDLWLIYREELQKTDKKSIFEELLSLYLEKDKCQLKWETVSHYLDRQKALFLIDGLDEVPQHLREDLVDIIARFQFQYNRNRFLLTGRPHGITGQAMTRFGADLHDIEPLDEPKIDDFIKKWFRAIMGRAAGLGEVTAEGMISDIRQHEHISAFTQNPLLLTAVCILYQDGKRIPEQRADLYNRIIGNLVHRRFNDPNHPGRENEILEFLMALAFEAQRNNRKTIEITDVLEILRNIFPKKPGERQSHYQQCILELFNEIEPRCGLFDCVGSDEIQFIHLTFQEFLAAKYMVYENIDWQPFLEKEWWEETLLLYTGFMSLDRKRTGNDIVETILKTKAREEKNEKKCRRLQILGARAICDFQPTKRDEAVISIAREQMIRLTGSDAALEDRFQAGELLGSLGDTRIGGDNMVMVPAGEFIRGSGEYENAKPVKRIYLDDFMIGVYLVTNQEFKRFVDDNGYHRQEYWIKEGWKWRIEEKITTPGLWYDRKWNGPNFPVVEVSWYEADAYIKWLSDVTKKTYRLPTDAEWEKAARGTDGRIYPWGNEFDKNLCNSWELELGRTNPVGIFPKGKSLYGCFDMAGNVWEWCADWYDEKYYLKSPMKNPLGPKTGSHRVYRGGGWFFDAGYCACAIRYAFLPGIRYYYLGFRLARSF